MKLLALASSISILFGGDMTAQTSKGGLEYVDPTSEVRMVRFNSNRVCAILSGIPYEKGEVPKKSWEEFVSCMEFMRDANGVED